MLRFPKHLITTNQLEAQHIHDIINLTSFYEKTFHEGHKRLNGFNGFILATLFFEPSTRTRFSFESAMIRLGGNIITLEQGASSSIQKGETLTDMGRMVSGYADVAVIRHPDVGSAEEFAKHAHIPVINGGDGTNDHPSQALVDLYTIYKNKGSFGNIRIGFVGDLKHSRTVYPLMYLLNKYDGNTFVLISDSSYKLNQDKKSNLQNSQIIETDNLEDVIDSLDVLYVVRVQKERFESEDEYNTVKNKYLITRDLIKKGKSSMIIMHPLPRVNEISTDIDCMPQAKYFDQAQNAVFVRMSLLKLMLES